MVLKAGFTVYASLYHGKVYSVTVVVGEWAFLLSFYSFSVVISFGCHEFHFGESLLFDSGMEPLVILQLVSHDPEGSCDTNGH